MQVISGCRLLMGRYINMMLELIVLSGYQILTDKEISASVQLGNILDAGNYGLIVSTNIAGLRQFEPNTGRVTNLFENDRWNNIFITNNIPE